MFYFFCVFQRINRSQEKKLKALQAELAVNTIELKARECIIEKFKTMLELRRQQICSDDDSTISTDPMPTTEYISDGNYMDCVYMPSNATSLESQSSHPSKLTQNLISENSKQIQVDETKAIEDSKTL